MAAPAIAVTTMFTLVFTWNEFVFAVFLTCAEAQTMPVALRKTIDVHNTIVGLAECGWGDPVAADGVPAAKANRPWTRARYR